VNLEYHDLELMQVSVSFLDETLEQVGPTLELLFSQRELELVDF
jgi:hypothetical protein